MQQSKKQRFERLQRPDKKCDGGLSITKVGMNVQSKDEDYFLIQITVIFIAPVLRIDHVRQNIAGG